MQVQVKIIIGTIAFMLTMILMGFVALREPARLRATTAAALGRSIENGAETYKSNCIQCHGVEGRGQNGGVCINASTGEEMACVGRALNDAALVCGTRPQRLVEMSWAGTKFDFVNSTLHAGRPWAGMPTWGADFGGPLSYNQIDDLTNFILNWETNELCEQAPAEPVAWPASVADLPAGNADNGRGLYNNVYACGACHGDLEVPGSNQVGPWIGNIDIEGAGRIVGYSAADYTYESILLPNAYISPAWDACAGADPCAIPSSMPANFGVRMNPQDMADILALLLGTSTFETEGIEVEYTAP